MSGGAQPSAPACRLLLRSDAEAIFAVHCAATRGLTNDMVRNESLEFILTQINDGLVVGVFSEANILAAYGALTVLGGAVDKVVSALDLDVASRARFSLLDGGAVHPDWQQRGLHEVTLVERLSYAKGLGKDLVGATVSPRNIKILKNLFNAGFCVVRAELLYGGYERLILVRDLRSFARNALTSPSSFQSVFVEDFSRHIDALKSGLAGFELSWNAQGKAMIQYAHQG